MVKPYQAALREAAISKQAVDGLKSLNEAWQLALVDLKWRQGETSDDYLTRTVTPYLDFEERIDGIKLIVETVRTRVKPPPAASDQHQPGHRGDTGGVQVVEDDGGDPVDVLQQAGADRRPGAGHPGHQRDALHQTDDDHLAQGQLALVDGLPAPLLGHVHHDAPQDQGGRDDPQAAQRAGDQIAGQQRGDDDRRRPGEHVPGEAIVPARARGR